jgi:hypothetical protein
MAAIRSHPVLPLSLTASVLADMRGLDPSYGFGRMSARYGG